MAGLPRGTIELLVRRVGGALTGDHVAGWGVGALTEGFDSPALRQLAGVESPTLSDTMPLFQRAVEELQLAMPRSSDDLYRAWLRELTRKLIDGELSTSEALDRIHREVLEPLNHPADLMPWCFLWEGLDPVTFASLDRGAIEAKALTLAHTWSSS